MKRVLSMGVAAVALVLLGAGCTAPCVFETEWDSCVDGQQADTALLGEWTLVSQYIVAPNGTVENPFNGRTLTFARADGYNAYAEDWTGEFDDEEVYTPDLQLLVSECDSFGTAGGSWASVPTTDAAGDAVMELWIVPQDGATPEVVCSTGGEVDVVSSGTSTPLGIGPVETGAQGPYVKYTYVVNAEDGILEIRQTYPQDLTDQPGDVQNVFLFSR